MTGNEYQKAALRTANVKDLDTLLINGVLGMCGETGEVADLVKKSHFQGHLLSVDKVKEELGDVLWYVAVSAHAVGCSLDDVMSYNVDKLMKRYPNGFDASRSINRPEYVHTIQ